MGKMSVTYDPNTREVFFTDLGETTIAKVDDDMNDDGNVGNISWSDRLSNKHFDGASAGVIQMDAPVLNVSPLRDRVICMSRNSIHQLVELDDPNGLNTAILPVTYNIGCANGWSVQEIGGDLIWLAHDGIRTLRASEQYGDVQFGNILESLTLLDNS